MHALGHMCPRALGILLRRDKEEVVHSISGAVSAPGEHFIGKRVTTVESWDVHGLASIEDSAVLIYPKLWHFQWLDYICFQKLSN